MSSELSVKDIQNTTFDNITSESSKNLDVKESNVFSATSQDLENVKFDEFIPITEDEKFSLPYKVKSGKLPWYIYLILLVEFAERASYYCCNDRLSNLVELPLPTNSKWGNVVKVNGVRPKDANAGALGKGLSKTNSITNFLSFTAYCFPLITSVVCDIYCKKMTMLFPDTSYGLLYLGVLILAWCSACIKPILLPLLLSQYKHDTDVVTREANDEIVILDRDLTLRRQTQWFYFAVNIGGFVSLGAGYLARDKGYFYAFLLPLLIFVVIPFILIVLKPKIRDPPPAGKSIIQDFFKIMKVCLEKGFIQRFRNGTFFEYALPSNLAATQNGRNSWLRSKPKAGIYEGKNCLASLINNLSAAMKSNGVPNDVINNFNPLAIIVFTPILDYGIYPLLTRMRMNPNITIRIFIGFMLAAGAMAAGAILQKIVYNRSVCGDHASTCGTQANVSLWETCIIYGLTGISETFAMVGGYQIAFVTSPTNMRSFVMAIFLFQTALSSIINIIISPSLKDPNLVKVFGAIAGIGAAFAFWWLFQYWNLPKDLEVIAADLLEYEQEMAALEEKRQLLEINDKIENGEIEIIAEKDMELNPVVSARTIRSNNAISPVVSALETTAIKK
ncbi:unnamed protein product [Hanseniaspora opuntiae]